MRRRAGTGAGANGHPDGHPDEYPDNDGISHTYEYTNRYADTYANENAHEHAHSHANANSYVDCGEYEHATEYVHADSADGDANGSRLLLLPRTGMWTGPAVYGYVGCSRVREFLPRARTSIGITVFRLSWWKWDARLAK